MGTEKASPSPREASNSSTAKASAPEAFDTGWETHAHRGDWLAFGIFIVCVGLMILMNLYNLIMSFLGL